jgi:2-polyprenyl-3-methyl-5-hydroxy-6-metoxy-1,4-benzoquinol methylase
MLEGRAGGDHHGQVLAPDPDRARLYGEEAERYDQTRPGYPGELIDEVVGASPQRLSVLDVGCGTGIASRPVSATRRQASLI